MSVLEDFKKRAADYGTPNVMRKSILSIRDGAGVIEKVIGGGHNGRLGEGAARGAGPDMGSPRLLEGYGCA